MLSKIRSVLWILAGFIGIVAAALAVINLSAGAIWLSTIWQLAAFAFFGIAVFSMD